jgi:hypothetical protein
MNFVIHDATGKILRTGKCPDAMIKLQAQEGEFVIEGIADDCLHCIVNGKIVEREVPITRPAPNYRQLRADAFPSIPDQLDAIWKGGEAAAEMKARIEAVKARIPKDEA